MKLAAALITATALVALTACSPLDAPVVFDRQEAPVECPTVESCATPTPIPAPTPDLLSVECAGLSAEECANPAPPAPNPTVTPEPDTVEGGG